MKSVPLVKTWEMYKSIARDTVNANMDFSTETAKDGFFADVEPARATSQSYTQMTRGRRREMGYMDWYTERARLIAASILQPGICMQNISHKLK